MFLYLCLRPILFLPLLKKLSRRKFGDGALKLPVIGLFVLSLLLRDPLPELHVVWIVFGHFTVSMFFLESLQSAEHNLPLQILQKHAVHVCHRPLAGSVQQQTRAWNIKRPTYLLVIFIYYRVCHCPLTGLQLY